MAFSFITLPELDFDLKAETTPEGRRYITPEGESYASVTTVLTEYNKKAIMEWRERVGEEEANKVSAQASSRGTRVHSLCETYLKNELSPMKLSTMMPDAKELFYKIKPFLDTHIGRVYALEQALYSDELRIAGRVDCIAEWNGKLSIIDFKTSAKLKRKENIEGYFIQECAYAIMWEERTGIPITQLVTIIAVDNEEPQVFIEHRDRFSEKLLSTIREYNNRKMFGR